VTLRPLSSTFQRRYKSIKRDKIVPQIMVGAKPLFGVFLLPAVQPKHLELGPNQGCFRLEQRFANSASHTQIALCNLPRTPPHCLPTEVSRRFFLSFAPAKELAYAVEISLRCVCPRLWIPKNLQRHSLVVPGDLPGRTLTASSPAALAHTIPFLDACADYAHSL
jgi:hypothetical protein